MRRCGRISYDKQMQPERSIALFLHTLDIPGIGPQISNSMIYGIWDVQTRRATILPNRATASRFMSTVRLPRSLPTSIDLPPRTVWD